MCRHKKARGFSLVELLLVLAIIGIISGIAIPAYLGQRRRARVVGDAQTNAEVLRMMLEARKAENGIYGTAGTYTWTNGTPTAEAAAFLPGFMTKGNSRMNFEIKVITGQTYELTVFDPSISNTTVAFKTNQSGEVLDKLK